MTDTPDIPDPMADDDNVAFAVSFLLLNMLSQAIEESDPPDTVTFEMDVPDDDGFMEGRFTMSGQAYRVLVIPEN